MNVLTKLQAEATFGKLTSDTVPVSYVEFVTADGTWKPLYDNQYNLLGYVNDSL